MPPYLPAAMGWTLCASLRLPKANQVTLSNPFSPPPPTTFLPPPRAICISSSVTLWFRCFGVFSVSCFLTCNSSSLPLRSLSFPRQHSYSKIPTACHFSFSAGFFDAVHFPFFNAFWHAPTTLRLRSSLPSFFGWSLLDRRTHSGLGDSTHTLFLHPFDNQPLRPTLTHFAFWFRLHHPLTPSRGIACVYPVVPCRLPRAHTRHCRFFFNLSTAHTLFFPDRRKFFFPDVRGPSTCSLATVASLTTLA